jgi:hypothetical protein
MANLAAQVLARELAKLPSAERGWFLHQLADQVFAGIIVVEGVAQAREKAEMVLEAIEVQGPRFGPLKGLGR